MVVEKEEAVVALGNQSMRDSQCETVNARQSMRDIDSPVCINGSIIIVSIGLRHTLKERIL